MSKSPGNGLVYARRIMTALLLASLLGCGSPGPKKPQLSVLPEPEDTPLAVSDGTPGVQRPRLNVSISVFDAETEAASSIYSSKVQVNSVERRYLPFRLKDTLDRSAFWGAVRVMPHADPNAELNVSGSILFSDGVELRLFIHAEDATGRVWLDDVFYDVTSDLDYASDPSYQTDPFQDLYNRIANELSARFIAMEGVDLGRVVDVATLKYAKELSPETFDRYLSEESGVLSLIGFPAADDPLFVRVLRIRESEYLFSDSVDAYYESLHRKLGPTYAWWRYYSYELIEGNKRLSTVDATRGATRGSWYAMERIYKTYKESKMNEDALRELTNSFDRETEPIVTELAGNVVRLTGTLEVQYEQWRRLLRELYRDETGY